MRSGSPSSPHSQAIGIAVISTRSSQIYGVMQIIQQVLLRWVHVTACALFDGMHTQPIPINNATITSNFSLNLSFLMAQLHFHFSNVLGISQSISLTLHSFFVSKEDLELIFGLDLSIAFFYLVLDLLG